jgi:hypothetical protein
VTLVPDTPDDGDIEIDGAANTGSAGMITARSVITNTMANINAAPVFVFIIC